MDGANNDFVHRYDVLSPGEMQRLSFIRHFWMKPLPHWILGWRKCFIGLLHS